VILWIASLAIMGAWALLLVAGIGLIRTGSPGGYLLGGVLLLIAVASRPRLGGAPEHRLTRDEAPELYRLVDDIADLLRAPRIHVITLDGDWNASTYRYGILRRNALELGVPLWRTLPDTARLAILGHEVAHSVNGDTTRGVVAGTALRTLDAWAVITEPESLDSGDAGLVGLVTIPFNLLMLAVSMGFGALGTALHVVSLRPTLRAEFYADRLGASVAGVPAMTEALTLLFLDGAYERAISAVALANRRPDELFDELDTQVALTPASELERRRRREAAGQLGLDLTHPPTSQRISLLEHHTPAAGARLSIDPERMRRIDAEVGRHEARVASDVVDEYRMSIYGM
jgi:Zn-dependent protease with chaperone function